LWSFIRTKNPEPFVLHHYRLHFFACPGGPVVSRTLSNLYSEVSSSQPRIINDVVLLLVPQYQNR
jgi:hypothetical protein